MSDLRITLFGPLTVRRGGEPVDSFRQYPDAVFGEPPLSVIRPSPDQRIRHLGGEDRFLGGGDGHRRKPRHALGLCHPFAFAVEGMLSTPYAPVVTDIHPSNSSGRLSSSLSAGIGAAAECIW